MKQDQPVQQDNQTASPKGSDPDKDFSKAAKTAQILKMQSEIRKMKKWIDMEIQLRKNKEQYYRISQDIQSYEEQIKQKKREAISENLMHIQQRRMERSVRNKETNVVLAKIKESHRQRRKRMESLVHDFKQEYDYVYQKKLKQRRDLMNQIDFGAIAAHQNMDHSIPKKRSIRIKTENESHTNRRFSKHSPQNTLFYSPKHSDEKSEQKMKRDKIMQLVNKRKQYGNRIEKEAANLKISMDILQKVRDQKRRDANPKLFQSYEQSKPLKKARLDTNLTGDLQTFKTRQISNIAKQSAPVKDKLNRLRHIVDGYSLQYVNGKEQVLDLMCSASLARANLLLGDS